MSEFSDKLKKYLEARNPYSEELYPLRPDFPLSICRIAYNAALLNLDILFKDCETLEHVKIKLDEATK